MRTQVSLHPFTERHSSRSTDARISLHSRQASSFLASSLGMHLVHLSIFFERSAKDYKILQWLPKLTAFPPASTY
jgi:hypothetical protein